MALSNSPYKAVHIPQRGRNQRRHGTWQKSLLVCNVCASNKQPDRLIKELETKSKQNQHLQKVEKEMTALKSAISEIKRHWTQNKLADPSDTEVAHSLYGTLPAKENLDGI